MKKLLTLAIIVSFKGIVSSATLVVEGKYQNKNVYVQNAFNSNGVGFCAQEIKVNGKITTDETNSSAFEIDLASLQLKYGENVTIEIIHKDGCTPKVLNMEDLKPKPTFEILAMNVSPTGLLKWTAKNETGSLPYIIEQFKWNKWIPIGEVDGIGSPENHEYTFQVALHSGENKYRVKQKGIAKANTGIDFNAETGYEVYDAYGVVVKKGFGKQIKTDNLPKGQYYLCYDNTMTEFKK
ncbi:MAG: hypothetical protein K0S12_984 [Bacteroidetes bacterium]|nr:hypothetical protein [Bacteroidota bacterium]